MKLLHLTYEFQYGESIEAILRRHEVEDYVLHARIDGHDATGKHNGSQAFPGHMTLVQALVDEEKLDGLLEDLRGFREEKPTHQHLRAVVLNIDQTL